MKEIRTVSTQELQRGLARDSGLHVLNVQTDRFLHGRADSKLPPNPTRSHRAEDQTPLQRRGDRDLLRRAGVLPEHTGRPYSPGPFANVRAYKEGFEGWRAAGNEIVVPRAIPAK